MCVHMCMGLRVPASCRGQSLHLSASFPDPVESLQGRLAATSGHIFSGVANAKRSLLAGMLMMPPVAILKPFHLCWADSKTTAVRGATAKTSWEKGSLA